MKFQKKPSKKSESGMFRFFTYDNDECDTDSRHQSNQPMNYDKNADSKHPLKQKAKRRALADKMNEGMEEYRLERRPRK